MSEKKINVFQKAKRLIPSRLKKGVRKYLYSRKYRDDLYLLRESSGQSRFVLMATPEHGNLGDHAIAEAELAFLADYFSGTKVCEITGNCYRSIKMKLVKYIHPKDILIITGGGFLGSLWMNEEELVRDIITSFPDNAIVIFPQTVFFENDEHGSEQFDRSMKVFSSHKKILFGVRDKASIKTAEKILGEDRRSSVLFVPDIVCYWRGQKEKEGANKLREGLMMCLRQDKERVVSEEIHHTVEKIARDLNFQLKYTDTVIDGPVLPAMRKALVKEKMDEFRSSRLVMTDRLHGMLFAAITATPCIAMDNSSGKVAGVHEWIRHLDYIKLATEVIELPKLAIDLTRIEVRSYDFEKLKSVFDDFARAITLFVGKPTLGQKLEQVAEAKP